MISKILLLREERLEGFGILFVNGIFQCFALENRDLRIPTGDYKVTSTLTLENEIQFSGDGQDSSNIRFEGTGIAITTSGTSLAPVVKSGIRNMSIYGNASSTIGIKGKETEKWSDGKEYPVFQVEISSASHPFYTGQTKIVDTAGRVEKFKMRAAAKNPAGKK